MTSPPASSEERLEEAVAMAMQWREEGRAVDLDALGHHFPELRPEELLERISALDDIGELLRRAMGKGAPQVRGPGEGEPTGFQPGQTLGEYKLEVVLGRGGMGTVYRAFQASTGRKVAVKVLPPGLAADLRRATRFQREIESAAALDHPAIVRVFGAGQDHGCPFYAMELVQGLDLGRILEARAGKASPETRQAASRILDQGVAAYLEDKTRSGYRTRPGGLDMQRAVLVAWIAAIARGLHAAHEEGIIHRDVKPGNILADLHGRARIADFGLARTRGSATLLTGGGPSPGTPCYMSPEQAAGETGWTTPATDLYSLAATLYHAVTGRCPFPEDRNPTIRERRLMLPPAPRRVDAGIPRDLNAILLRAMDPDPSRRHPSCRAFAQDLEAFLRGDPVLARPLPLLLRMGRWVRRKPLASMAAASLLLAALAGSLALQGEWSLRKRLDDSLGKAAKTQREAREQFHQGRMQEVEDRHRNLFREYARIAEEAGSRPQAREALLGVASLLEERLDLGHAGTIYRQFLGEEDRARGNARLRLLQWPTPPGTSAEDLATENPPRRLLRNYLGRQLRLTEPVLHPSRGMTFFDIVDAEGNPGSDGRAEIIFPGSGGRLFAWSAGCLVPLTPPNTVSSTRDSRSGESFRPSLAARRLPGKDWPLLVLVSGGLLRAWTPGFPGDRAKLLPVVALQWPPGSRSRPKDPFRWIGDVSLGVGPAGHPWAVLATRGWTGAGDWDWDDLVVDLESGSIQALPGTAGVVSQGVAVLDVDGDGSEEILLAEGEWQGYGCGLYRRNPETGEWVLARFVRLGKMRFLCRWDRNWFLACKEDVPNNRFFDWEMPSGAPCGFYPVHPFPGLHGLDLETPAARADLAFLPEWGRPQTIACAALGGGKELVLGLLVNGESRYKVLAGYLQNGNPPAPDLSGNRELFWIPPDMGIQDILGAADLDGDGEEEFVFLLDEGTLIAGWDEVEGQ
ncbi:MAG: protein kinase [Planctomycetota bacterium]